MKTKLTLAAMAVMVALSAPAFADGNQVDHFYVGADTGTSRLTGDNAINGVTTGDLHIGYNVTKNVALELGTGESESKTKDADTISDLKSTYFDVVGSLPVSEQVPHLDAVALVGVVYDNAQATQLNHCGHAVAANSTDVAPEVGAGLQYHVSDAVAVRGLAKYEDVNLAETAVTHAVSYTAGVNVSF